MISRLTLIILTLFLSLGPVNHLLAQNDSLASKGKSIRPLEIVATGGFVFLHDFGGEGMELFRSLHIGPSFTTKILWRPSMGSGQLVSGTGLLLGMSYRVSSHKGKGLTPVTDQDINGQAINPWELNYYQTASAAMHRVDLNMGLYVPMGRAKRSTFEVIVVLDYVGVASRQNEFEKPLFGGPNDFNSTGVVVDRWNHFWGFATDYAFNFAITNQIAIRWGFGASFIFPGDATVVDDMAGSSVYSNLGLSIGLF